MRSLCLGCLVVASVLLAGCVATLQPRDAMYAQQGRYAELGQYMETQVHDVDAAPTSQLFYLCLAYLKIRNYEKLRPCVSALQGKIDAGDTQLYNHFNVSAEPALLRAEMALDFGDYRTALSEAQIAERITADGKSYKEMRIYALYAVALTNALNGNRQQALEWAAALQQVPTGYPDNLLVSDKAIGLAKTYMALGDYRQALDALATDTSAGYKALTDLLTGARATGNSLFTYWDLPKAVIRAHALLMSGDVSTAKTQLDSLLAMPQLKENGDLYWIVAYDRGRIAVQEGHVEAAVDQFKSAIEEIESQRSTIGSEADRIGFVGDKQAVYSDMVAALISIRRDDEAFEYVERAKARALVDLLASKKSFTGGDTPADVNKMLGALAEAERKSMQVSPASNNDIAARGVSIDALVSKINAVAPETASLVSVQTLKTPAIQAKLRSDEAIVEYFFHNDGNIYAFVVDRNGVKAFTLDGKNINDDVQNYRDAIENQSDDWKRWSRKLYDRLVTPVAAEVQNNKHLTVVPHGALHYLPFNALMAPNGEMLIEQHTLRLLPSASVLQFLDKPAHPTQGLLVFGNPARSDAPRLPGAEAEAEAVGKLWADSHVVLGDQATETLLKRSAAPFRFIHLASHAQFKPDDAMQSRILLSADSRNDGDLTVSEIYDLNLNADIATLSACQTDLGEVKNGDDVVGLTRGFLYAGAKAIVSSLWEVPDEPTTMLMTTFYRNLKSMDMRTAFQQAQVAAYRRYQDPLMWAAFQMTGGE